MLSSSGDKCEGPRNRFTKASQEADVAKSVHKVLTNVPSLSLQSCPCIVPVLFGLGLDEVSAGPRRCFVGETDRFTVARCGVGSGVDAGSVTFS